VEEGARVPAAQDDSKEVGSFFSGAGRRARYWIAFQWDGLSVGNSFEASAGIEGT